MIILVGFIVRIFGFFLFTTQEFDRKESGNRHGSDADENANLEPHTNVARVEEGYEKANRFPLKKFKLLI